MIDLEYHHFQLLKQTSDLKNISDMIWFLTEVHITKRILTRKKKKSNLNSIKPPELPLIRKCRGQRSKRSTLKDTMGSSQQNSSCQKYYGTAAYLNILKISSQHLKFSVQFSRSVVSNPLRSHGLQHARPLCPSPTPRLYSNSCPLSW